MRLTGQQIRVYEAAGFLTGIRVVDEEAATQYRNMFDALEAREQGRVGLVDRHLDQPFVWELGTHPTILDCIESLIGPDILLLTTQAICKYGRSEMFLAWHRDLVTYWGRFEPPCAITAWYAIDDSDPENGCVRVIPGTHRRGLREHGTYAPSENPSLFNPEVAVSKEDEGRAVDLVLRAGEISLHDGMVVHGSVRNRSARRRCGLALRYVPTLVKPVRNDTAGPTWSSILVRGEDKERNFGERGRPFPV